MESIGSDGMNFTTSPKDLIRPLLVTVIGLGLTDVILRWVSPAQPGQYTVGWWLSPVIGVAAVLGVGYVAGRLAASTQAGVYAVASGATINAIALTLVYGRNWIASSYDLPEILLILGPGVAVLMSPGLLLARSRAQAADGEKPGPSGPGWR